MEKKSIGKFIAALRQSKGMTQKELGDMLNVSNRTVSRRERDECTPDLYLIPTIADIFGISADELLRGEIDRSRREENGECRPGDDVRTKKRFAAVAAGKYNKLRSLSFIPLGLAFAGLIAAAICALVTANCIDDRGYHIEVSPLGFLLALVLCAAGIICEVCFALNAYRRRDDEFENCSDAAGAHNARILTLSSAVIFADIAVIFFALPLVATDSRILESAPLLWPGVGLYAAGAAVCVAYLVYCKSVRRACVKSGNAVYPAEYAARAARENKILAITAAVCTAVFAAAAVLNIVIPEITNTSGNATAVTQIAPVYHLTMILDVAVGAAIYAALKIKSKRAEGRK